MRGFAMTKLEAIQIMLTACGLNPPSSLDTGGASDAANAERILDDTELRIQTKEQWNFNRRANVELKPDGAGKIRVPDSVIAIDTCCESLYRNVVQVGDYLYDKDNNTDVFAGPIKVEYTLRYDWDCIPHPIQDYIAWSSAMDFYGRRGVRQQFTGDARNIRDKLDATKLSAERHDTRSRDACVIPSVRSPYRDTYARRAHIWYT